MGDFQDVFGAGADADSIIDGISRAEMRYQREENELENCKHPKVAASFFDLTGQTWQPAADPLAWIRPDDEERIEKLAQEALDWLDGSGSEPTEYDTGFSLACDEASILLDAIQDALQGDLKTLHEVEHYLTLVIQSYQSPAVLVRMTGIEAGYAGQNLTTHAIVLSYGVFIGRFADLTWRGPLPNAKDSYDGYGQDAYRSLALMPPGGTILAISAPLTDPKQGIIDPQSWIAVEQAVTSHQSESRRTVWDDLLREAGNYERQGRVLRSWTDGELHHLTRHLRSLIAPLIDETLDGEISLCAGLSGTSSLKLDCSSMSRPRDDLIERLLTFVDVRHFVMSTRFFANYEITLLKYLYERPIMHERLEGKEALLALLSAKGFDRSAVSSYLEDGDYNSLARLLDPKDQLDAIGRQRAEVRRAQEAALDAQRKARSEVACKYPPDPMRNSNGGGYRLKGGRRGSYCLTRDPRDAGPDQGS